MSTYHHTKFDICHIYDVGETRIVEVSDTPRNLTDQNVLIKFVSYLLKRISERGGGGGKKKKRRSFRFTLLKL